MKHCLFLVMTLMGFLIGSSCSPPRPPRPKLNPAQIAGTYLFQHPDGQVETWTIHSDFTFDQAFYKSRETLSRQQDSHRHHGKWKFTRKGELEKIAFEKVLMLRNWGDDGVYPEPQITAGLTALWDPPTSETKAVLDFYSPEGYVAVRE